LRARTFSRRRRLIATALFQDKSALCAGARADICVCVQITNLPARPHNSAIKINLGAQQRSL